MDAVDMVLAVPLTCAAALRVSKEVIAQNDNARTKLLG
jgi:hypothetical protein